MKKILFTIVLTITLGLTASAQRDGFFNDYKNDDIYRTIDDNLVLPNAHGSGNDYAAPLGSGLLVLTALGAGYAVARKRYSNMK